MQQTIVHVDDDSEIRANVKQILETAGYRVVSAESVQALLNLSDLGTANLFLLDIMVEEDDSGLKAYDTIQDKFPTIPIVILSSLGDGVLPHFQSRNVMPWILEKPVQAAALLSCVKRRLA